MAKILLVEDDNNLREIYEARLMAEGYEIVAARDGEEALTVAMKEKPDLIISDVMMPKISGFDMLDILRTTEETKNAKVIMMTALSQAEDKARAEKLGADRYLVKSQVTLEDVAKVAKQVLEGEPAAASELPAPQASAAAQAASMPPPQPAAPIADPVPAVSSSIPPSPQPVPSAMPMPTAGDPVAPPDQPTPAPPTEPAPDPGQPIPTAPPDPGPVPEPGAPPAQAPAPVPDPVPMPVAADPEPAGASSDDSDEDDEENTEHKKKVIQPINDMHEDPQAKLNMLLEKEKQREEMAQTVHEMVQTTQQAVSTEPGVDAPTSEAPIPPPSESAKPDPNAIAL